MNRVLIIILEGKSASGICAMNVAKKLSSDGWDVDVLSATTTEVFHRDGDTIRYFSLPPKFTVEFGEYAERVGNQKLIRTASLLNRMTVAATSLVIWPWNSPFFTARLYREVLSLHKSRHYTMILPVYTQIDPIIAGHLLKRRFPKIKYIPYFLDSLSGGPTPRLLSTRQKIRKGLFWEKKLLSNADFIILMRSSQEHHRIYSSALPYYNKMRFLDIPMLLPPDSPTKSASTPMYSDSKTVFTYIGNMPLSVRSPYYGLKMLNAFENIEVRMVGSVPESISYLSFCQSMESVKLIGAVPHGEVSSYIRESDVLLNFGNKISEMVPSKIFEYMSYGKPILSFSPDANDPSIVYLQKYPNACVIIETEDQQENAQAIRRFMEENIGRVIPFSSLQETFYENTPDSFTDLIRTIYPPEESSQNYPPYKK